MFNTLLKKIIKQSSGKVKSIMAFVGLAVALLLILLAVQIQVNYNYLLHNKSNADSAANFLVLNKQVNNNTINATTLSNELLADLEKQPFIDAVGKINAGRFKASVESLIPSFPFYTDIAFESVPDDFIDVQTPDWQWTPNAGFIPMIIPNMFLDIYNFQFSVSQGYPQITPDMLKMMNFKVNLYNTRGVQQSFIGRIVGFSDRISSVMVPQSFMDWANKNFAAPQTTTAVARVVIKTKDAGNPQLTNYLKQNGLTTDADKTRFSKYRKVVNVVVNVSGITGAIMLAFALLVFTLFIQITIANSKQDIALLISLGASPVQLQRFLIKQFYPPNLIIIFICLVILAAIQFMLHNILMGMNIYVSKYLSVYTIAVAIFIALLLWWVNINAIRKSIVAN